MPTYEYRCLTCETEFESVQSIMDDSKSICPKCESKDTLKLIAGSSSFVLKGGGWAADNYSSKK